MKNRIRNKSVKSGFSRFLKISVPALLIIFVQLMMISPAFAQAKKQVTISGTVTDQDGEPLVGVNVVVKHTIKGTITDVDGHYSLNVNSTDSVQYSFIGYTTQEIALRGRTTIDVTLKQTTTDLGEVVVVGYGEVKRANLLGAVSSISAKEIEDIPVTNLTQLLDGRMAGVSVSPAQPTGNPGASTRVQIRTETTFGTAGAGAGSKDPSPLYIVDGFEVTQEQYDVLDPSEIESFSVLKDASAAVYGSKGANGVVLVKTKRGRVGKLRVNYSGSVGVSDATQQTNMLSAYDQARMLNARYADDPTFTQISSAELDQMKGLNYDWLGQAWQAAYLTRHTINISGGSEKVQYFAGGSYNYQGGNFKQMGVGKYSYRLGLDAKVTKDLSVSATIAIDGRDFKRPYLTGTGTNTLEGLFQQLLQAPKWTPPYINGMPIYNGLDFNPFALFESGSYRDDVDKGNTLNLKLTYTFPQIKGLVASGTFSRRESNSYYKQFQIPYTLYEFFQPSGQYILSDQLVAEHVIPNNNRIAESYSFGTNYQLNLNLNYNAKFGPHSISAFATYEQTEGKGYGFSALRENQVISGIETQKGFDSSQAATDGTMNESGDLGAVARLNYSYADKYLLESTVRYESTTLFAPGNRSGLFPSVSVGWVLSEENFMKNSLPAVNYMKLRYSIGLTGFNSIVPYQYSLNYGPSGNYLFGGGLAVGGMAVSGKTDVVSTGVTWEKSRMQNVGLDMKFMDSRLSFSIDGYYTYQYDILTNRTVDFPQTSGIVAMPSENLGRLEAWGYDMTIGYNGKIGSDIRWNINGIFSFGTNRILSTPTPYSPNDFRYPIGQSTSASGREQGYITKGIIRTQAQLDAINAAWTQQWGHPYTIDGKPAEVGSLFIQDIARPGNISAGEPEIVFEPDGQVNQSYDITYIQRVNDHFVWKNLLPSNVSLGLNWKDVSVSMLFSMAYGISNEVVDKLARTVPTATLNSPAFWSDYWTPDNTDAAYPSPKFATSDQWASTFWMKNVVQLRMKNLNISYNIPAKFAKKLGIPDLRLYFVGTNLWSPVTTFHYKEDAISRYNTYPLLRTFNFGVNLKM